MRYGGVYYNPPGGDMYFRTTPYFETASEKYDWLNRIVAVGIGWDLPEGTNKAMYSIHQIL